MSRRACVVTIALAALCAGVVVASTSTPVRVAFAIPLLFVLPGYALAAALFDQARLATAPRFLLGLGLSIAAAILTALFLDVTRIGLGTGSWAMSLALVTVAAAGAGALRPETAAPPRRLLPRVRGRDALLVVGALAVTVTAVVVGRTPVEAKNAQGFTSLWVRPALGAAHAVRLGVQSSELQVSSYRLVLRRGSTVLLRRDLRLEPGDRWVKVVPLAPGARRVRAYLYRGDRPGRVYRWVGLALAQRRAPTAG
jgi:hypothetical protein